MEIGSHEFRVAVARETLHRQGFVEREDGFWHGADFIARITDEPTIEPQPAWAENCRPSYIISYKARS
jgi:hypothetical protein